MGLTTAKVPVLPTLDWPTLMNLGSENSLSLWREADVVPLSSGTAAIAVALLHANVGSGQEVLVPSYHCLSMVDAIRITGAVPVFVKVREDLSIDLDDAERKVGVKTAAVLIPHYFGFPQKLRTLEDFCESHSLDFIQDCAHMLPGSAANREIIRSADYAIFSAPKFFPASGGGYLVSFKRDLTSIETSSAGALAAAKALLNIAEVSSEYGRLRPLGMPIRIATRLATKISRAASHLSSKGSHAGTANGGADLPSDASCDMLFRKICLTDSLLVRRSETLKIAQLRRENYFFLVDRLRCSNGTRPVFSTLDNRIVPYMLPLLIDDPHRTFPALKSDGIPIFRWENLATNDCEVSTSYSQTLIQLPVHQSLRKSELTWIADTIVKVIGEIDLFSRKNTES